MSSRGSHGRGMRWHQGRARAESSSMGSIPILKISETVGIPTIETRSQTELLCVLEKVVRTHAGPISRGSVIERFRSNEAKLFKGVTEATPIVAEYWLEATEGILDDIDCTPAQKLRGTISLLQDVAYQWWLTVEQGAQL